MKILRLLTLLRNGRRFNLFVILLGLNLCILSIQKIEAQNCSVNAGIPQTICANEQLFLQGSFTPPLKGGAQVLWQQVGGPAATIVDPTDLHTEVKNIIAGNSYTFRIWTTCGDGALTFQDVTHAVKAITIASAGPDATYCPGAAVNLSANSPGTNESGLWSGSGNGITVNNPISPTSSLTIAGNTSGSVTLRWTITNSLTSCSSYDEVVITNRGGVTPVSAGTDQVLNHCYSSTQSTTLSGSFAGSGIDGQRGTWSIVSGPNIPTIANSHSNSTTVTNLIEGVYVFRWTVAGTCISGSDEVQVTVPAPTADVTGAAISGGNPIQFCDPTITSTVLSGTIPKYVNETVHWVQTSGPAVSIEDPNSPVTTITGLSSLSSYAFSYTIRNAVTSCSSSATVTVSYYPNPPSLSITSSDPVLLTCNSTSATINFLAGGSGTTQYQILSGPSGTGMTFPTSWINSGGSPLVINGLTKPGTYLVQMRRSTMTGGECTTPFAQITIVSSLEGVSSNAGTDQILDCNVTETDLIGNDPTAAGGTGQGTWSQVSGPSAIILSDPHSPILHIGSLLPNGLYVFRWLISGGPLCPSSQDDVQVYTATLTPSSRSAGTNQTNVCYNTPAYLNAEAPQYVFERGTWTVSPSTGVAFSDIHSPQAIVTGLSASTLYTFTWTISNGCGSASSSMTIDVINTIGPIVANAGPDQCLSSGTTSISLSGNDPAPGTGLWIKLDGPAATITSSTLKNTSVTGLTNGTYHFEWAISSGGCNPTRDTVTVTIDDPVTTASAGVDLTVCGTTITMNPGGVDPTKGSGKWIQVSGNAGVQFDGSSDPSSWTKVSPVLTNLQNGTYIFRYTVTNGACVSSDDVTVFVSDPAPSPADAGPDKAVCGNTSVTMEGISPVSGNGRWSIISGPNTPTIVSPTLPTSNITGLITGSYVFRWTVSGGTFCTPTYDDATVNVTLSADAGSDQSYCEEIKSVKLTGTLASTGTWTQVGNTPNTATITKTSDNIAIASNLIPGFYTFEYSVSIPGCIPSTDQMTVTLYSPPSTSSAGADQTLCNASIFNLNADNPASGTGTWTKLSGH